jgi:hypothetical protein
LASPRGCCRMSLKTIARPTRSSIEYNADAAGKDEMTGVRRKAAGPRDYGVTVARVAAITYGKPARDPVMLQSGITRAEAMAYRDARGQAMTDADWTAIEDQLLRAYQLLKTAVAGN